ncbi:MAG: phage terminase large subunit family protein [Sedimentisphaerales bacterium]|nr:phage terminase large subunit family protein [Sedimentisphaerales bacterium]
MPSKQSSTTKERYQRRLETANEFSLNRTRVGQDIAPLPPVKNPARRARANHDFRFFCETYFPNQYTLAWSDDHLKVISKIESVVIDGERYAIAMPRGSGKTTLCATAVLWAVLSGRHLFVFLIAQTNDHAVTMMANIQTQLITNKLLLEDYPDAVYPFHALRGESRRCAGQSYYGERTFISWGSDVIVFADIPDSPCSGAVICVSGITGAIRGKHHTTPGGAIIRPTLAVVDDPQTDQSARSPMQIDHRMSIVKGAIRGLAGPGKQTAIIIPCTVIQPNDMADQLLNRKDNPVFQGERTKMLYEFPANMELWDKYAEVRAESYQQERGGRDATEFYAANREAMDVGARVAWPARYVKGELSAVQNAMNIFYDDEPAFWAEYQNEPMVDDDDTADKLTADQVSSQLNNRQRGEVPFRAHYLTAFIDVHDKLLYYVVCAWMDDFTGWVIDYGTYPDQGRRHFFTVRNPPVPMAELHKGLSREGVIQAGLDVLAGKLLSKDFVKAGEGGKVRLDRLLVDAGYKPVIIENIKRKMGGVMMASKGVGIRAGQKPMSSYRRKPGERYGDHWMMPSIRRTMGEYPYVAIDTNYWKTFSHERLMMSEAEQGNMTLFGKNKDQHRMFADHIAASETWTKTEGHGRVVHQWETLPGSPDNHWFDCLVGNCAAASMCGCQIVEQQGQRRRKKTVKLSELQKQGGRAHG